MHLRTVANRLFTMRSTFHLTRGIIGAVEGLKGAPDGYTLIMLATTNAIAPHVVKGHPPAEDFDPLCIAVIDPMILAVSPESPFKTAKDLIAYAKANPKKLSGGTSGAGGPNHLVLAAFATAIGSDFSYVPFKGSAPALLAAAGKHVDMSSAGGSEGLTLSQAKKIRVLISFSDKRSPLCQFIFLLCRCDHRYLDRGVARDRDVGDGRHSAAYNL